MLIQLLLANWKTAAGAPSRRGGIERVVMHRKRIVDVDKLHFVAVLFAHLLEGGLGAIAEGALCSARGWLFRSGRRPSPGCVWRYYA